MHTITFGTYELGATNNIHLQSWRELHGAERDLTVLNTVGVRGVHVLQDTFEGKVLELTGAIECNTNQTTEIQNFVKQMVKQGQPLTIENDEGVFVYDGVYVTNTGDMVEMRTNEKMRIIKFRLVFLCPKGFARSTSQTTQTTATITTLPYSGSITITGDTSPEPIITVTLVDASTITDIFFTNQTTNQQISVSGITFVDGDVLVFDTEDMEVRHNGVPVVFDGVFPEFTPGLNNYQLVGTGGNNLVIDQPQYDAEETVYGSKKLAWKFTAPSSFSASQIALLPKKVTGTVLSLYDDFNDNSIDTSKWAVSGTVSETGGKLRVGGTSGQSGEANTDNKTTPSPPGDPITGAQFNFNWSAGGPEGPDVVVYLYKDGTDYLEVRSQHAVNKTSITGFGAFAGLGYELSGTSGTVKVVTNGTAIELYVDSVLRASITSTFPSGVYMRVVSEGNSTSGNFYMEVDNVYFEQISSPNSTITVRIETDTAGVPSGTLVTNGSFTISSSDVGDSFTEVIKAFATNPSLTNETVYHVVISQSGGDINNYYVFKIKNSDVFANANLETYDGAAWTQHATKDLYVKIWSTNPVAFDLTLAVQYYASYFNIG